MKWLVIKPIESVRYELGNARLQYFADVPKKLSDLSDSLWPTWYLSNTLPDCVEPGMVTCFVEDTGKLVPVQYTYPNPGPKGLTTDGTYVVPRSVRFFGSWFELF